MLRAGLPRGLLALFIFLVFAACSSPNRGWWQGSFEGDVAGTMELSINARGTKAKGEVTGRLSSGEGFRAEFEGTLNQGFLRAELTGSSETSVGLRAGFEGLITGDLAAGKGAGQWKADLKPAGRQLEGEWQASQDPTR